MSDAPEWIMLLRLRVDELGSIAAVATELGYSRPALSLALKGSYPARVTRLAAAVIAKYRRCECPHLGHEIVADDCRRHRTKPMPQSSADALRFWTECQRCPVGRIMAEAEAISAGAKGEA